MLRITPNVRRRPAKRREVPRSFPAPLFYYLLVQAICVLVSFLLYEVTIVVATALLVWRPWYPFRFLLYTLDPDSLSPARLRVLSFLRSPECTDAAFVRWRG